MTIDHYPTDRITDEPNNDKAIMLCQTFVDALVTDPDEDSQRRHAIEIHAVLLRLSDRTLTVTQRRVLSRIVQRVAIDVFKINADRFGEQT